jgi:hypothetical protein
VIIIGQKYTRSDGYTTDLEQSQAEEIMPSDCTEIQDAYVYFALTTGSMTKAETLVGSVMAVKEVTVACGSVGNEWLNAAQIEVHRCKEVASVDSSYPSDTLLGKINLNNSNLIMFEKPTFSDKKLHLRINHNAGTSKLVTVNIRYFSKDFN